MTDTSNFGPNRPVGNAPSGPLDCSAVEAWLAESAEQTLPAASLDAVTRHAANCVACNEKLALARHGWEWLLILHEERLAPPAGMVAKILARTSHAGAPPGSDLSASASASESARLVPFGSDTLPPYDRFPLQDAAANSAASSPAVPLWQRSSVVLLRRTLLEPRLALVAAMAFFSISLTLNLMGVRLTHLRAADLTPRNMRHAITRQYVDTNARVVRYYENLRIVYEVEARVQQLRRAAETSAPPEQETHPRKRNSNTSGNSGDGQPDSHRDGLAARSGAQGAKHPAPAPIVTGPTMDASFHWPALHSPQFDRSVQEPAAYPQAAIFRLPFAIQPVLLHALPASSCPLHFVCCSTRPFSTRDRRLA